MPRQGGQQDRLHVRDADDLEVDAPDVAPEIRAGRVSTGLIENHECDAADRAVSARRQPLCDHDSRFSMAPVRLPAASASAPSPYGCFFRINRRKTPDRRTPRVSLDPPSTKETLRSPSRVHGPGEFPPERPEQVKASYSGDCRDLHRSPASRTAGRMRHHRRCL